jgi:hypothetical protein
MRGDSVVRVKRHQQAVGGHSVYQPPSETPKISPIFKADTVRLHVSREKDGKWCLVYAGWDEEPRHPGHDWASFL